MSRVSFVLASITTDTSTLPSLVIPGEPSMTALCRRTISDPRVNAVVGILPAMTRTSVAVFVR